MPTGYTADVADGTITDLRSFALRCARAFGACVTMRDERMDAPIPERFEPYSYHLDEMAAAQHELETLNAMSAEDRAAAAGAEFNADSAAQRKYQAEKDTENARYDAMIEKVLAWQHSPEGIKDFMLQQLRDSKRGNDDAFGYVPRRPLSGDEWFAKEGERLRKDIAYHAKGWHEEQARTAEGNMWLAQLRASLPPEEGKAE